MQGSTEDRQRGYVEDLIDQEDDFDRWYVDVVKRAELADDAPVRGCKVVRPYGFALWENIQAGLDRRFKKTGVQNAYFPLLIPQSFMEKEAEHVEGFAPEVAWVTRGGRNELEEPLAIRPTSEAMICHMYGQWVQSYRDLPILINQWCSVLRWENRPRAFLRTSEFLWQEGHTAHANAEEAQARARQMLDVYQDFVETELAIPVIPGRKSESEKFAGAVDTYTIEAMMGGKRWALQSGTSHYLGENFAKAFGIDFLDADGERKYAHSTSWGLSHRTIGAVVMVHGDDSGLKMPPRVAPVQAVVIPIWRKEAEQGPVEEWIAKVVETLDDVRTHVDRRDDKTPGWKFNEWELRGVPLRIEVGPRDVQNQQAVVVRRDTREKQTVTLDALAATVSELLETIQRDMFEAAKTFLRTHTVNVSTLEELYERVAANAGFSVAGWCGDEACEAKVKNDSRATIRCLPFDQPDDKGSCIVCDRPAVAQAVFARAY